MTTRNHHTPDDDGTGLGVCTCGLPLVNARHIDLARLPSLNHPAPASLDATATSIAAAARVKAGSHRARALAQIAGRGEHGATDDELERALGIVHQSLSSARGYLADVGLIERLVVDGVRVQRTVAMTGNRADVWVATNLGHHAIRAGVAAA